MRMRVNVFLGLGLVSLCGSAYVVSHDPGVLGFEAKPQTAQPASATPVPVQTAVAKAQDVPIIVRGLGSITAFNTVSVKSRVQGNITQVAFREGQEVKTGDILFQIDPRPYQAALDQVTAQLAKDQASLANARADLARYAALLKRDYAPEQQYATQQATVAEGEAAVKSDQAQIDAARINVDYATIRSPIDGVTGIRQVDLGNLVQANNAQTLVVVTQVKPIYVMFTVPEADIAEIRSAMAKHTLKIQAFDSADERQIAEGTLNLVDNQVDQTTGTVKLKAEFANADERLWPGQFVNAHLVLEEVKDGVTIPAAAVQTGPNGAYAYVIKADDTVEQRAVTIRQTENDRALIGSGLMVSERVVTGGQFRLKPGVRVAIADETSGAQGATQPMASR